MLQAPFFRYNELQGRVEIGPGLVAEPANETIGRGTTAGAVPLVLSTVSVPAGQAALLNATVLARSGSGAIVTFAFAARVQNPSGTPLVTVDTNTTTADAGLESAGLDLIAGINAVNLVALGVAGQMLSWAGTAQVLKC